MTTSLHAHVQELEDDIVRRVFPNWEDNQQWAPSDTSKASEAYDLLYFNKIMMLYKSV